MENEYLKRACERLGTLKRAEYRSETARLGVVFDDIERAIVEGMKLAAVHGYLKDAGLALGFEGFRKARLQLLKRRKKTAGNEPSEKATNGGSGGSARLRGAVQRPPRFEHNPDANAIEELLKYDNGDE